ncbi:MAG: type II toxin-antitoxin system PemK/MazF family toxin [Deltaproteobacteria bacterium]
MAISFHPALGTIVICDFHGFVEPEMVKRRLAIVMSPNFKGRDNLCTIIPFSTTPPKPEMPYHYKLLLDRPFPPPYDSPFQWVKADMLATVSFSRLSIPSSGKSKDGQRIYIQRCIAGSDLKKIQECMLNAMGLSSLTKHL